MKKLFPAICILLTCCQSWDRTPGLTLYNKSDKTIYYWASCDSGFENIYVKNNILKPGDSVMPYLLYGPEGKGPNKDPWINAINSGDDSALHIFCLYVDFTHDHDFTDTSGE